MKPETAQPAFKFSQRDTPFQRREWLAQRIGWALLAALLLAGLLGLFGDGPLARASVEGPSARIEYDRFARRTDDIEWRVHALGAAADGWVHVAVDAAFAGKYQITDIMPEPENSRLDGMHLRFAFQAAAGGAPIVFHVRSQHAGRHTGGFQVGDAAPLVVSQLVYP